MTNPNVSPESQLLSEQQLHRVLNRAIELDKVRAGATSVADLQRIAEDLNISPSALAIALNEVNSVQTPPLKQNLAQKGLGWWRAAAIGTASALFAAFNASMGREDVGLSLVLAPIVAAILVVLHRRSKTPVEFHRDLLALYSGGALGWITIASDPGEMVRTLLAAGISFLLASAIGGFAVRMKAPTWLLPAPSESRE